MTTEIINGITRLTATNVVMGSKAVVIDTGATYMMDSTGTWTLMS